MLYDEVEKTLKKIEYILRKPLTDTQELEIEHILFRFYNEAYFTGGSELQSSNKNKNTLVAVR